MHSSRFPFVWIARALLATAMLTGCASGSDAIGKAVTLIWESPADPSAKALNPNFQYLRATTQGHTVLLVLGYVEPAPDGPVEIWYSGQGEVLHLQNGRLVATAGLDMDWRQVRYDHLPAWTAVGAAPIELHRRHDEIPGYRFGITDVLRLAAIAPPTDTLMKDADTASYRWFEERAASGPATALPPARYAVKVPNAAGDAGSRVEYAEQCLSATRCIAWQRWPGPLTETKPVMPK